MPKENYSELYQDAWEIARNSESYESSWRRFRRAHMAYDREVLIPIFDRTWDRAERVKYMADSNQGLFISREKLGCPETGNRLFYTLLVTFNDEGGNQHEQYFHVNVPIMRRIGQTNQEANNEMITQLSDRYFRGWMDTDVKNQISNVEIRNVRCLTGGD